MKGSMTVEASWLFPICFAVIGIIFYLGIFQYNRAVLKMTGYECILQNIEELSEDEEAFEEILVKAAKRAAEERTLGVKDFKVSVKITSTKVLLSYECIQKILLESPLEVKVLYERIYPELTLRLGPGE